MIFKNLLSPLFPARVKTSNNLKKRKLALVGFKYLKMPYKTIAGLIPTIQATQLVGHNLKVVKKKDKSIKDIIGLGVKNIVGISLIQREAQLIGEL